MTSTKEVQLSSLTLRRASRDQILESRNRSWKGFARGLSLSEYLARDDTMDSLESASDGRLSVWVLIHRDSPADSFDFLCACRTFKREASVIRKSGNLIEPVVGYAIASVFTPEENRRKGYAAHMMRLLHWVIAPLSSLPEQFPSEWGIPPPRYDDFVGDAALSLLYSDVGPDFYHRTGTLPGSHDGWVVRSPSTTTWDVTKVEQDPDTNSVLSLSGWKWLSVQDVDKAWEIDTQQIHSHLSEYPFSSEEDAVFAFHPGQGVADYQVQRLKFYWSKVQPPLQHWGLCHARQLDDGDVTSALSTFATWTVEHRPPAVNSLIITRMRASQTSLKPLIKKVISFASQHHISEVEVWNLEPSLNKLATEMGGKTFGRRDHLPSFKWYGAEEPSRVTWAFNEK